MKIYLDDKRPTPEGWIGVETAEEVIYCLKSALVQEISFDHDLGTKKTGYDVLLWIERQVATTDFIPPAKITIHTDNPVGRQKMEQAVEAINKLLEKRKG